MDEPFHLSQDFHKLDRIAVTAGNKGPANSLIPREYLQRFRHELTLTGAEMPSKALNAGAKIGGFAHNTGEGGIGRITETQRNVITARSAPAISAAATTGNFSAGFAKRSPHHRSK